MVKRLKVKKFVKKFIKEFQKLAKNLSRICQKIINKFVKKIVKNLSKKFLNISSKNWSKKLAIGIIRRYTYHQQKITRILKAQIQKWQTKKDQ